MVMTLDQHRRAVAMALGLPDKSVTLEVAARYEIEFDKDGFVLREKVDDPN